jgi:hypothetical protein
MVGAEEYMLLDNSEAYYYVNVPLVLDYTSLLGRTKQLADA